MSGASDLRTDLSGLVGSLATDLQDLVRGEIRLARAELSRNISHAVSGAGAALGGAILALAGFLILLQGGALLLGRYMPVWGAFCALGGGVLVIGAIVAWSGMSALSLKTLTPDRTSANLRKDVAAIKEHT